MKKENMEKQEEDEEEEEEEEKTKLAGKKSILFPSPVEFVFLRRHAY